MHGMFLMETKFLCDIYYVYFSCGCVCLVVALVVTQDTSNPVVVIINEN